jgi:hypothetical protein
MPILGIIDSAKTGNISTTAYDSIATASGTGSSNTITFSSIPSNYKHLQVRAFSLATSTPDWISLRINGDTTTANYRMHRIYGTGTSAVSQAIQGGTYTPIELMLGGSTTQPSVCIMDFIDYSNTNKNTTMKALNSWDTNGGGQLTFSSILWQNTAVVNELHFRIYSSNFNSTTRFALYGIKG